MWEELPEALRPQHAQVPGQRDAAKETRRQEDRAITVRRSRAWQSERCLSLRTESALTPSNISEVLVF